MLLLCAQKRLAPGYYVILHAFSTHLDSQTVPSSCQTTDMPKRALAFQVDPTTPHLPPRPVIVEKRGFWDKFLAPPNVRLPLCYREQAAAERQSVLDNRMMYRAEPCESQ